MFYVGIDQSYTSTGYCVLENEDVVEYGTFKTSKDKDDIYGRVADIATFLVELSKKYPDSKITMEGLAFGIRGNATRNLAGLQFVIMDRIKLFLDKDVSIIAPTALKKFATGYGGSKNQKVTKTMMIDSLPEAIRDKFKSKHKASTGLADITDAYYLAKYTQHQTQQEPLCN